MNFQIAINGKTKFTVMGEEKKKTNLQHIGRKVN